MLRRMKKDVMQDLPPKTKRFYPVDVDKKCLRACDELLAQHGGLAAVTAMLAKEKIPFELFSTVRSILASAKVPAMLALVEQHEEEETPLLVFSAHRAPIDLLSKRPGWEVITGDTPAARRSEIEDAFQAGKLRGIGGTIKAAGVAITLTHGSNQVFVDQELTPSLNEQAEDRQLRHGQKNAVLITVLVANHILDERVAEILLRKQALITASVDAARDQSTERKKGP
jgi:SNF2 family DNA or RNA helicase